MVIRYVLYPIIGTPNNYISLNNALQDSTSGDVIKIYNGTIEKILEINVYFNNNNLELSFNISDLLIINNLINGLSTNGLYTIGTIQYNLVAINGGTPINYNYGANNLILSGNTQVSGSLSTTGQMITIGDAQFNGNLDIDGNIHIVGSGTVDTSFNVNNLTANTLKVNSTLDLSGNTNINGNLNIVGNNTIGGYQTINGDLTANSNTYIGGNLEVAGTTKLDNNTQIFGELYVDNGIVVPPSSIIQANNIHS